MMKRIDIPKAALALIFSIYFIIYVATYRDFHLIDGVSVVMHEGGHFLFAYFGEFIHVLGGTFFQVAIPVGFIIYFFLQRAYYSSSILLFWLGQNLMNISIYASDAITQELPLLVPFGAIGSSDAYHDWTYLLSKIGLLDNTALIGSLIFASGVTSILLAVYCSFRYSFKSGEDAKTAELV